MFIGVASAVLFSCSAPKKLKKCGENYTKLDSAYRVLMMENAKCQASNKADLDRIKLLESQLADSKANSNQVLNQLKDLSVI